MSNNIIHKLNLNMSEKMWSGQVAMHSPNQSGKVVICTRNVSGLVTKDAC